MEAILFLFVIRFEIISCMVDDGLRLNRVQLIPSGVLENVISLKFFSSLPYFQRGYKATRLWPSFFRGKSICFELLFQKEKTKSRIAPISRIVRAKTTHVICIGVFIQIPSCSILASDEKRSFQFQALLWWSGTFSEAAGYSYSAANMSRS